MVPESRTYKGIGALTGNAAGELAPCSEMASERHCGILPWGPARRTLTLFPCSPFSCWWRSSRRNDPCPYGSGRRFQAVLPALGPV